MRSVDAVLSRSKTVQTTLFAVGRGAVLLALLVAGLWGLALMERVRRILAAMQQVASGDFDVEVPEKGHDEIAAIARSLVHMIRKLRGAQAELQSSAAHEREGRPRGKATWPTAALQPSVNGFEFAGPHHPGAKWRR